MNVRQILTSLFVIAAIGAALMFMFDGSVNPIKLLKLTAIAYAASLLVMWLRNRKSSHV